MNPILSGFVALTWFAGLPAATTAGVSPLPWFAYEQAMNLSGVLASHRCRSR